MQQYCIAFYGSLWSYKLIWFPQDTVGFIRLQVQGSVLLYIQHCNTIASIQHHRSNLSSARYTTIGAGYHPRMLGESTSSWSREDPCQLDASWTITSRYRCAFNIIWTQGVISDKRYFCVYDRSKKLSLKGNFTSGVQLSLNFRTCSLFATQPSSFLPS